MLSGKFAVVKSRSNSNPTFPVVPRVPRVALTLNPRLIALGLRPRHSPLVVGYRRGGYNKKPIHKRNNDFITEIPATQNVCKYTHIETL